MTRAIGAIDKCCFGLESTAGTEATTMLSVPVTMVNLNPKVESVKDDSAVGRREMPLSSAAAQKWAEPEIEGYVYDILFGYLLKAALGTDTKTGAGDPYTHTYTVLNSNAATFPTMTIKTKDDTSVLMCTGCVLSELTLTAQKGQFLKYKAKFVGKFPATDTETPSYTEEGRFLVSTGSLKLAANVAGLGAASAVSFDSCELSFNNNVIRSGINSDLSPERIMPGHFSMGGSVDAVFEDEVNWALFGAHTAQALRLALTSQTAGRTLNVDITQARLEEWGKTSELQGEQRQSFIITPEYKLAEADMVEIALLNNRSTAY